jgi:quinoprotein glucose dehydrogenase
LIHANLLRLGLRIGKTCWLPALVGGRLLSMNHASIFWFFSIAVLMGCSGGGQTGDPDAIAIALAQARSQAASAEREWQVYLGDKSSSQYSPLTQIHRGNVQQLELAWQYDASAGDSDLQGESQHNPLIVRGVLYGTAANAKRLFALNAATGEEIWAWEPAQTMAQVTRGLLYWCDDEGQDERILFGSGSFIHAVDARTGQPVKDFGNNGSIDLTQDLMDEPRDFDFLAATTPGVIYRDLLIQGMRVNEFSGAAPGHIRAYDIRSGQLRWRFNTIPQPGEYGANTWPENAHNQAGGANAWAGMALDDARGLVFIPTGSAALDTYGADRTGDNLFANSLLALDAATGERRWHYQVVRHDLWDRDLPSPPNLITLEREGQSIDAVVQATKSGHLFVFNRDTGEPLFPIREEPVYGQPLPGEVPARSQPLPVLPEPFTAQGLTREGLDDRSEVLRSEASERLARYSHEGVYNLPSVAGSILMPGFDGGAEWGGSAWDQQRGLLYINANEVASVLQMVPTEHTTMMESMNLESVYRMGCGQCHGNDRRGAGIVPSLRGVGWRMPPWDIYSTIINGRGRMPAIDHRMGRLGALAIMLHLYTAGDSEPTTVPTADQDNYVHAGYPDFIAGDGLPATKPPWGTLNAIDISAGKIRWRIPLGDYPSAMAMGLRGLGSMNYGGPVATAGGLVFIGATPDATLKAYDSDTGELLWQGDLPAGGFATPAVYETGGQQYVVISASGTKMGNPKGRYYLAFSLQEDR